MNANTMKTLKDLFLEEVADMYDAERRISRTLAKLALIATSSHLQDLFHTHAEETREHAAQLESIFHAFHATVKAKKCHVVTGLIEEAQTIAATHQHEPTLNAALIFAAQKIEHYEIASYGTLREWAKLLGADEAAHAFQEMLNEELAANHTLTEIALSHDNGESLIPERDHMVAA